MKVGATLLEDNSVVKYGPPDRPRDCNWISNAVDASKVQIDRWKFDTQAAASGAPIIDWANAEKNSKYYGNRPDYEEHEEDIQVPFNSEVVWEHDFYKH